MTLSRSKHTPWTAALTLAAVALPCFAAPAGGGKPPKPPAAPPPAAPVLIQTMEAELHRAMADLGRVPALPSSGPASGTATPADAASSDAAAGAPRAVRPYFISYAVSDAEDVSIAAQFGAITNSTANRRRNADVQIRLGSPAEDNTHGDHRGSALTSVPLPLSDDREALERSLWYATNRGYGRALDSYLKVKTEQQVRAREEDSSADFSTEPAVRHLAPADPGFAPSAPILTDRKAWEGRLRELSAVFTRYPDIVSNTAALEATNETDAFVSSDGAVVSSGNHVARLVIVGRTRAADGMDLFRAETFESDELGRLPDQATLLQKTDAMAQSLEALRVAPVTEPFDGPAILSGRAAAVFFHEVLGHRLEGQRQRGESEGQTFTKLLGKPILPAFLSVADDPTLKSFDGVNLSGYYSFDSEGQPAQRVQLVKDGVLETFLMSRQPIRSVSASNGHGRAESGHMPTGRQGNLIVTSSKTVPEPELRELLKAEARRQGKEYGLYFEDISSGFAVTTRSAPQAFSVIPLVVYRVYVDGRPDQLVRGVSIVGTPQTALKDIVATGNREDVFNGICGAESGSIPVSAVAPAMLLSKVETQRQAQGSSRPPLVPPPPVSTALAR